MDATLTIEKRVRDLHASPPDERLAAHSEAGVRTDREGSGGGQLRPGQPGRHPQERQRRGG
eukprot:4656633-Alexandrium_andersonii.AAC.1